jgi:hypothetical protein
MDRFLNPDTAKNITFKLGSSLIHESNQVIKEVMVSLDVSKTQIVQKDQILWESMLIWTDLCQSRLSILFLT